MKSVFHIFITHDLYSYDLIFFLFLRCNHTLLGLYFSCVSQQTLNIAKKKTTRNSQNFSENEAQLDFFFLIRYHYCNFVWIRVRICIGPIGPPFLILFFLFLRLTVLHVFFQRFSCSRYLVGCTTFFRAYFTSDSKIVYLPLYIVQ